MLKGVPGSPAPWSKAETKFVVTVPGYDRHFLMLERLGIGMIPVEMTAEGPDIAAVERAVASDPAVKGLLFVPTYSNPTGETTTQPSSNAWQPWHTAARTSPFSPTILRRPHPRRYANLTPTCSGRPSGRGTRRALFSSHRHPRSTFACCGDWVLGCEPEMLAWLTDLLSTQMITPTRLNSTVTSCS